MFNQKQTNKKNQQNETKNWGEVDRSIKMIKLKLG